ncbi:S8 family serine peptidase, partial [Dokdonia ponticola]
MKKHYLIKFILTLLFSVSTALGQSNDDQSFVENELYVKVVETYQPEWNRTFRLSFSEVPVLSRYVADFQITEIQFPYYFTQKSSELQRTLRIKIGESVDVDTFIRILSNDKLIEYVERVPMSFIHEVPNDDDISTQWSLSKVRAFEAWDLETGANAIDVAIVDSGVQTDHPDLMGNMADGWDVSDNDSNPNPINGDYDHGTHVAGLVGAVTNNSIGMASVGYNIDIMPIKATNSPNSNLITHGYEGILWAASNGAEIINCSWGGEAYSQTHQNIVNTAYNTFGSIIVTSAGNDNTNVIQYPAGYNNTLTVAATNQDDSKRGNSNYGSWVDISAPGSSIYSTLLYDDYGNKSGTSMASPIVAAALGLVWSADLSKSKEEIIDCVLDSAVPLNWSGSGSGRLDVRAALDCILDNGGGDPIACECPFLDNQFPNNTLTPTNNWQSVNCQFAGEFSEYNVSNGETYVWSYCTNDGGNSSNDLRINVFDGNGNRVACNMDSCGLDPRIVWTSNFTGIVRVQTNEYINGSMQCETNLDCATLVYKIDSSGGGNCDVLYADQLVKDGTGGGVGNDDGQANPGEEIDLEVALEAIGCDLHNVSGILNTNDSDITITDDSQSWGDILEGQVDWTSDFDFDVDANTPEKDVVFTLEVTSDEDSWVLTFIVHIYADGGNCDIAYADQLVKDGTGGGVGNDDGQTNPGEEIDLEVALEAIGCDLHNVSGILNTNDSDITITDDSQSWGDI